MRPCEQRSLWSSPMAASEAQGRWRSLRRCWPPRARAPNAGPRQPLLVAIRSDPRRIPVIVPSCSHDHSGHRVIVLKRSFRSSCRCVMHHGDGHGHHEHQHQHQHQQYHQRLQRHNQGRDHCILLETPVACPPAIGASFWPRSQKARSSLPQARNGRGRARAWTGAEVVPERLRRGGTKISNSTKAAKGLLTGLWEDGGACG